MLRSVDQIVPREDYTLRLSEDQVPFGTIGHFISRGAPTSTTEHDSDQEASTEEDSDEEIGDIHEHYAVTIGHVLQDDTQTAQLRNEKTSHLVSVLTTYKTLMLST